MLPYGRHAEASFPANGLQIAVSIEKSLEGEGFVMRVHVGAMHIFDQRYRSGIYPIHVLAHDRRDRGPTKLLESTQPTVTGDHCITTAGLEKHGNYGAGPLLDDTIRVLDEFIERGFSGPTRSADPWSGFPQDRLAEIQDRLAEIWHGFDYAQFIRIPEKRTTRRSAQGLRA
jgi:hypothetical protein